MVKIILYGSCARGDYTEDSDIDIAVVNFVCLPYEEYIDKNDWYDYFRNIKQEGRVLYG